MSLFDSISEPVPAQHIPEPAFMVTLKPASNGVEILLCNVTPPPEAVIIEARSRKLPLFTFADISAMRQAGADDPRYVDALIETRRVMGWGGAITYRADA
jgi:hypothetical protein